MVDSEKIFDENVESIKRLYRQYSAEELAAALFVSNLWLPNIASYAKHTLFTMTLSSMKPEEFLKTSAMNDFSDFRQFWETLYQLSPNFMTLEDYVPKLDWGEIRFPFGTKKYRIFHGGDLEDAYDYLTLFEIIYRPVDGEMTELAGRSPLDELGRVLTLQDAIIRGISSQPTRNSLEISPGDLSIPTEVFWRDATRTYEMLDVNQIAGRSLLREFSITLGKLPLAMLSKDKVVEAVSGSQTFPSVFIEHEGRHFPILPRRMFGVLFDAWGGLLKRHQDALQRADRPLELEVAGGFSRFIKERFSKNDALFFVSACDGDKKSHEIVFPAAIKSRDKLILFYVLPPATDGEVISRKLAEVSSKLEEAVRLLQVLPIQLILHLESKRAEFRSGALTPMIFIVIPQTSTGPCGIRIEQELPGRVEFMDSVLAILDEIYEAEQLSDFLDYLKMMDSSFMLPMISLMDKFASFQDTHGVLIGGASEPDMVMLDPHWGSSYRFQSLVKFWSLYPERDWFGDPRSWQVHEEGLHRIRLTPRSFFGSVLFCQIGKAHVFITCPFDAMSFEQVRVASFLAACAEDNLYQYRDVVGTHRVFKNDHGLIVQIFPHSLVTANSDFTHLRHLDPGAQLWCSDTGYGDDHSVRVRIVFNSEAVEGAFLKVQDRSMEAALLLEIVQQLDSLYPDNANAVVIEGAIAKGKGGKPRFKFGLTEKPASFPELVNPCLPTDRDFRLAKKRVAQLAKEKGLTEGKYDLAAAKEKLGALRKAMIVEINTAVAGFDFFRSISLLLGWADALADKRERGRMMIRHSLEHEVDYSRDARYAENENKFTQMHRNYRYLIEKFIQLEPSSNDSITEEDARFLLAFIDWFLVIAGASDSIHYDISPTGLNIDHDFIVDVEYTDDMKTHQAQFASEDAQLRLGLIGNSGDKAEHPKSPTEQMTALDEAFRADYGFKFTNLVQLLIVLTYWPRHHEGVVEAASYSVTQDEIAGTSRKAITSLEAVELGLILDFLTLKPEELLRIIGDDQPCDDLPVWEHNKRSARYTIRPLIKIESKYHWGPYAVRGAGMIWSGSPSIGTLPVDIGRPSIGELLEQWKHLLDVQVELCTAEVVKRFTPHVTLSAELYRLDRTGKHPDDLGDYDVLAYGPKAHAVLNIECKNMLPVYCMKDARRLRETIFGVAGKDEGHFRQIDKRQQYLLGHWEAIAKALRWPLSSDEPPNILSLYVTPITYWWTRFPPRKVDTTFLRVEMLSKFIQDLTA
jgi:hypothetical protein